MKIKDGQSGQVSIKQEAGAVANIDLEQKNSKNEHVWQLMPWDNHPNKEANIIYSKKILELIKFKNNNEENFKPDTSGINEQKNPQEYIYPLW